MVGVTPSHQTPRLGPPEAIAAAAQPIARARGTGRETAALFFLTIGSILLPIVGWVIGLLLLWASPRWTARQKYLGTLVPPGGWLFFAWVGLAGTGTSCVSSETVDATSGKTLAFETDCNDPGLAPQWLVQSFVIVAFVASVSVLIMLARALGRPV